MIIFIYGVILISKYKNNHSFKYYTKYFYIYRCDIKIYIISKFKKTQNYQHIQNMIDEKLNKGYNKLNSKTFFQSLNNCSNINNILEIPMFHKYKDNQKNNIKSFSSHQQKYSPNFFDIANKIDPEFKENNYHRVPNGNLGKSFHKKLHNKIIKIINEKKMKIGDILFIGSSFKNRQEYGFAIIIPSKNGKYIGYTTGEYGLYIPIEDFWNGELNTLSSHNLSYKKIINEMINNRHKNKLFDLFLGTWQKKKDFIDIIESYKRKNLW